MNNPLVDRYGRPILALGLQAHNSSSCCDAMLDRAIDAVKQYHGNTLEAPVYWYEVEKAESQYDTTMVEHLIQKVRDAGLHLVILWFGFSKNTDMTYMPEWAKRNTKRFPMVVCYDGYPVPMMSPHSMAVAEADAKAFEQVMLCIKRYDEAERTVIAVQVENEIGMYPTDRCYSQQAEKDFAAGVPAELDGVPQGSYVPQNDGNGWHDRFGRHANEAFTCWYIGKQIECVASRGRAAYPGMPLYLNAAVGLPNYARHNVLGESYAALDHARGQPVARVLEIYRRAAPSIDLYAPDIYFPAFSDYEYIMKGYTTENNPLFIPETGTSGAGFARSIIHAAADYGAIGICGFGAENTLGEDGKLTDEARKVATSMQIIGNMAPMLLKHRLTDKAFGVTQEEFQPRKLFQREAYRLAFQFTTLDSKGRPMGRGLPCIKEMTEHPEKYAGERSRAIVYEASPYEYYMCGINTTVRFTRYAEIGEDKPMAQYNSRAATELTALSVEEGHFTPDGEWVCDFQRRGDEIDCFAFLHPGCVVRVLLNPEPIYIA